MITYLRVMVAVTAEVRVMVAVIAVVRAIAAVAAAVVAKIAAETWAAAAQRQGGR
jgi:hypothetical protein